MPGSHLEFIEGINLMKVYRTSSPYNYGKSDNKIISTCRLAVIKCSMNRQFFRMLRPKTLANKEIVKAVLTMFLQGATEIYKMQNNLVFIFPVKKVRDLSGFFAIGHEILYYSSRNLFLCRTSLGLSLPHFCSTIKKVAGNTPLEVIASIILMDAKSRLKSTNEPVKNIALSLGFNNISFFNKFFKQHTGVTPQEYRGH